MSAPAKTPRAIVQRLNTTINRVLPELQDRYTALGMDLAGGTPEEFGEHLKRELEKWARVVKLTGAKAN
jgi:tripartite-type tricarboxylate transporter receptor subunit TctC